MRRPLLLLALFTGCSRGPQADLPAISDARSLAAEWALVNDQATKGRLTATYTRTMRDALRQQLQTSAKSLSQPKSRYGLEIAAVLAEPEDASPEGLRAHADKLKQMEDQLESA